MDSSMNQYKKRNISSSTRNLQFSVLRHSQKKKHPETFKLGIRSRGKVNCSISREKWKVRRKSVFFEKRRFVNKEKGRSMCRMGSKANNKSNWGVSFINSYISGGNQTKRSTNIFKNENKEYFFPKVKRKKKKFRNGWNFIRKNYFSRDQENEKMQDQNMISNRIKKRGGNMDSREKKTSILAILKNKKTGLYSLKKNNGKDEFQVKMKLFDLFNFFRKVLKIPILKIEDYRRIYLEKKRLGKGRNSVVRLLEHRFTKKKYAAKIYPTDSINSIKYVESLRVKIQMI